MFTTVGEAVEFLYGLRHSGIKLGLENMQRLCAAYDDPQLSYPVIHVAGTNGKGSVVAMLESIFVAVGIRCAAFTSPHLQEFNERIRVEGQPIEDADLVAEVNELQARLGLLMEQGHECTFFEATNAMAFAYFQKAEVQVAIVETGLGGRLDSTNVADPLISVITSIGLDHQSMLGDTIEKIAEEKAGIIKPGRPVVLGEMQDSCVQVMGQKAKECNSPVLISPQWSSVSSDPVSMTRCIERAEIRIDLGLISAAQIKNAATVYAVIDWMREEGWKLDDQAVATGFRNTRWPARFQRIHQVPDVILDGAHNAAALADLSQTWTELYSRKPDAIAFGCLQEKLTPEFVENLIHLTSGCKRLIVLPVEDERAASCDDIRKVLVGNSQIQVQVGTVGGALEEFARADADQRFLIFGSLYLAGAVLAEISGEHARFQPELNG